MSFKDKQFTDRYNDPMWHHSEDQFEKRWHYRYERFGLDQDKSKIDTWALDPFIRHAPDYVSQLKPRGTPFFIEVQGTGTKNPGHKFKFEKLKVLGEWNRKHDVWLWLWNDKTRRYTMISLNKLNLLIAQGKATRGSFDGGKRPYWELDVDLVENASDWDASKGRYE